MVNLIWKTPHYAKPPPGVDVKAAARGMLLAVASRCQAAGASCGGAAVNVCGEEITV
jgi:hypothetical protein